MKLINYFICAVFVSLSLGNPQPSLPQKFFFSGIFSLPYANITEIVTVNQDGVNNKQRIEFYGGLDGNLIDGKTLYHMYFRESYEDCLTTTSKKNLDLTPVVPDLSLFTFQGEETVRGIHCFKYDYVQREDGGKINYYYFFGDKALNTPVRFSMMAYDTVFGSHMDEYIMDYVAFVPNFTQNGAFDQPSICKASDKIDDQADGILARLRSKFSFMEPTIDSDADFKEFVKKYNKPDVHSTIGKDMREKLEKYAHRSNVFRANKKMIEEHNKKNLGYKLAVNHFADLTVDEFRQSYLPKKVGVAPKDRASCSRDSGLLRGQQQRQTARGVLPDEVDWRGSGAVGPVKDQGSCGSCWAFSTTQSLEGQHFLKTGEFITLSEQQLMDCSWSNDKWDPNGNQGCDGGFQNVAFEYIIRKGYLDSEDAYPYLMANSYCKASNNTKAIGATMKSYVNVTMFSEPSLKIAVAEVGPVSVSICVTENMIFYDSGVFYDPKCGNSVDDLDHAVLAVGYGTENGQDYWLVKNSWSTHWGDDGYIKMARNRDNNCGTATQALYPVVQLKNTK